MNKLIVTIIFLKISICYAVEYNSYEMEVEHVFPASHFRNESESHLGLDHVPGGGDPYGPTMFFDNELLVVADRIGKPGRTIYLNQDYTFGEITKGLIWKAHLLKRSNFYIGSSTEGFFAFTKENNSFTTVFSVDIYSSELLRNSKDYYYQYNTLFFYDKNDKLWAIKNPGLDEKENRKNLVSEEVIIEEINNGVYEDLTIDSKNRLFYEGDLQTISYRKFVQYWSEKNDNISGYVNDGTYTYSKLLKSNYSNYLGVDSDNNHYWSSRRTVIVFSEEGKILDRVRFDIDSSDTYPAVSPDGDVFFMDYGIDKVTLYKIKRKW